MVSHGVQPYLHDFAAVVLFLLRVTCTPDADLCTRLLGGKKGLGILTPPAKLVRQVFDKEVWFREADEELLQRFTADLIALNRKSFLAAMRAIRTYVTGLHRVADDLELAYILMVASVESLAQDFDGHSAQWSDYEQTKRNRVDKALGTADRQTADRVRSAILEGEHVALARRFREFVLAHIPDSDFLEGGRVGAAGKLDLRDALKEAYDLRSKYVHRLRNLPHLLDADLSYSETIRSGHATYLTLEGLSRITRQVILEFVAHQPKGEHEQYDYRFERYGIVSAELAAEYWIWQPDGLIKGQCVKYFSALLYQVAAFLTSRKPITDLGRVVAKIEGEICRFKGDDKRAAAAIYVLFNCFLRPDQRSGKFAEIEGICENILSVLSIEALVLYVLFDRTPAWSRNKQREVLDKYFEDRNKKASVRVPELLEAGMVLSLAERFRDAGQFDQAKSLLEFAAVNILYVGKLASLAAKFDPGVPIDWRTLLSAGWPKNNSEAPLSGSEGNPPDSGTAPPKVPEEPP